MKMLDARRIRLAGAKCYEYMYMDMDHRLACTFFVTNVVVLIQPANMLTLRNFELNFL